MVLKIIRTGFVIGVRLVGFYYLQYIMQNNTYNKKRGDFAMTMAVKYVK